MVLPARGDKYGLLDVACAGRSGQDAALELSQAFTESWKVLLQRHAKAVGEWDLPRR